MWREQWERINRRYKIFQAINAGQEHDKITLDLEDDVRSFFTECFHLKDWLKSDPGSKVSSADVESFVNASGNLRLCADLANGAKHLLLTNPRVDAKAGVTRRLFKVGLYAGGDPQPTDIAVEYTIEAAGEKYDAFKLATDCLAEWNEYLGSKGLL